MLLIVVFIITMSWWIREQRNVINKEYNQIKINTQCNKELLY